MQEETNPRDLKDRLELIESMIAEGRRSTESWGWIFVLWGVAYYVAIAWAPHAGSGVAWPVTMIAASVVSGFIASRKARHRPETTIGRALGSVWLAMSISLFAVLVALGWSGRLTDGRLYIAVATAMLGAANIASSMILRWKLQFGCAVVWLATAVAVCFVADAEVMPLFVGAIFLCQIVFGFYGMFCEARARKLRGASHA